MDMKISGAGMIGPGEYESVHISGSGKSEGLVRCSELHISGAFKGESFECSGEAHISGSGKFNGYFSAKELRVSGAFRALGEVNIEDQVRLSGAVICEKNLKTGELHSTGATKVSGDIEAETALITGGIHCEGLFNAEDIKIHLSGNNHSEIGSVGCGKIRVENRNGETGLIQKLFGRKKSMLKVNESIEGDEIFLENTEAKTVIGRNVVIGEGCKIENLQYSESAEISEKAVVKNQEKI